MKNPIKNDWNKTKLYPYLFQEELYRKSTISINTPSSIYSPNNNVNYLRIKRIIHALKYRSYSEEHKFLVDISHPYQFRKKILDTLGIRPIEYILNNYHIENKYLCKKKDNRYNSIHTALISLEYQWFSYGLILEEKMYLCLHTEIILRILRKIIHDASFLHYLRQILHSITLDTLRSKSKRKNLNWNLLSNFLWNISTIEFQKLFFLEYIKYLSQISFCDSQLNDTTSCFHKLEKLSKWNNSKLKITNPCRVSHRKINSLYQNDTISYKFIHTKKNWFLSIQSKQSLKRSIYKRYRNYLENRLGYLYKSNKTQWISGNHSSYLAGYKIVFKLQELNFSIFNIDRFLKNSTKIKSLRILIPFFGINSILSLYGFCNSNGYPITKLGWTTWSDGMIIMKFKHLRDSLLGYYSGAMNQKDLLRIQHILHYSCAKTLACKHKTNLRRIWGKYGTNLSIFGISNSKRVSFGILRKNKFNIRSNVRFWNLYFKQPNVFSISLDKTYNN